MTTTAQTTSTTNTAQPKPWIGGAWGAGAAIVINSVIFFAANAILSGSIQTAQSGKSPVDLPYAAVAMASVIPVFAGAAVLWALIRFTSFGLRQWSILAAVLAVLSLGAVVTMQVDGGSKIALALMHLLTGAVAIWGQRRAATR
ncbi:MAG: DUF6069 family protein [Actinomycetes bacterium]